MRACFQTELVCCGRRTLHNLFALQMFYKSARVEYHPVGVVSLLYTVMKICSQTALSSLLLFAVLKCYTWQCCSMLHIMQSSAPMNMLLTSVGDVQVGAIVPWNYPFHNVFNPLSAAIYSGNAIVIKVTYHSPQETCISVSMCTRHAHANSAILQTCSLGCWLQHLRRSFSTLCQTSMCWCLLQYCTDPAWFA